MARVVKPPDERRSELIAAAQKLFYTKGYERTSITDIVRELDVAKGTFYYYFDSKLAILEAIIDDIVAQTKALIQPIVADESLSALEKWHQAIGQIGSWKQGRREEIMALTEVLAKDENVILVHKMQNRIQVEMAPVFAEIIAQGVEEGVFETDFPQTSAEICLAITQSNADQMMALVLHPAEYDDPAELFLQRYTAVQVAIERVLGAPPGSIYMVNPDQIRGWFRS